MTPTPPPEGTATQTRTVDLAEKLRNTVCEMRAQASAARQMAEASADESIQRSRYRTQAFVLDKCADKVERALFYAVPLSAEEATVSAPTQGESQELKPCRDPFDHDANASKCAECGNDLYVGCPSCAKGNLALLRTQLAQARKRASVAESALARVTPPSAPTQETPRSIVTIAAKRIAELEIKEATLERELKEAREELDAYRKGCESAKRGENHWHGQWELNQTEKINLCNQLAAANSALERAQEDTRLLDGLEKLTALARNECISIFAPQVPGELWSIEHEQGEGPTLRAAISAALAKPKGEDK